MSSPKDSFAVLQGCTEADVKDQLAGILERNPELADIKVYDANTAGLFPGLAGAQQAPAPADPSVIADLMSTLAPLIASGQVASLKVLQPRAEPKAELSLYGLQAGLRRSKLPADQCRALLAHAREQMTKLHPSVMPGRLGFLPMPFGVMVAVQSSLLALIQQQGAETDEKQKLARLQQLFGDVWPMQVSTVVHDPEHDYLAVCWGCGAADKRTRKCDGCKQARYCSKECQTAHWKQGHRAECSADSKLFPPDHVEFRTDVCIACNKPPATASQALLKCGSCKKVVYCSKTCQRKHWKLGHKNVCRGAAKPATEPAAELD